MLDSMWKRSSEVFLAVLLSGLPALAGEEKKADQPLRLVRKFTNLKRYDGGPLAVSPDGGHVAVAEDHGFSRAVDPSADVRRPSITVIRPDGTAHTSVYIPRPVATIYEVASGKKLLTAPLVAKPKDFHFSPDGKMLAVTYGSNDGIGLMELHAGGRIANIKAAAFARVVAFSPDGRYLVYAHSDDIYVFGLREGRVVSTLKGHEYPVYSLAWSGDGKHVLSGAARGTLRLWDVRKGTTVRKVKASDRGCRKVMISPDGHRAVLEGYNGLTILVNLETGKKMELKFKGERKGREQPLMSPDGKRLVACCDKAVLIFDTVDGRLLRRAELHLFPTPMVVSRDGGRLLVLGEHSRKHFKLWALEMPWTLENLKKQIAELEKAAQKHKDAGRGDKAEELLKEAGKLKEKLRKLEKPGPADKEPD